MSSDFFKDLNEAYKDITEEVYKTAVARARYRVQEDFNRELVEEIAKKTDHENLAATCFVDVNLESDSSLDVHFYNDWRVIDGLYNSSSSYHQSGQEWKVVTKHYGMHQDEFWNDLRNVKEEFGDDPDNGWRKHRKQHGAVDPEWIADNFWDGVYWMTNGWPLGNADFLQTRKYNDVAAVDIIDLYHKRYVNSCRFQKYIQQEINKMK